MNGGSAAMQDLPAEMPPHGHTGCAIATAPSAMEAEHFPHLRRRRPSSWHNWSCVYPWLLPHLPWGTLPLPHHCPWTPARVESHTIQMRILCMMMRRMCSRQADNLFSLAARTFSSPWSQYPPRVNCSWTLKMEKVSLSSDLPKMLFPSRGASNEQCPRAPVCHTAGASALGSSAAPAALSGMERGCACKLQRVARHPYTLP
ncbi:uncharacterized protein LOC127038595 isoform X1 [Gopherus flavomarginatus]|uniref:uncharacterized protein LOC127038595 isoform X1 n=1 Tax=Gopherus flavomarginatus TaxID=286002 RepID=UPI0021CB9DA1|nr:uncharacterized protein LOC127038595 isoform X1 [Gopherus flavomarginatus]